MLTASLADRMQWRRLEEYVRRTGIQAYERTLRSLRLAPAVDFNARAMARGDR